MAAQYFLYRHFDKDEALLYVGLTRNILARTGAHSHLKDWFDRVTKITIERYETRQDGLQAERDAIQAENPVFNIAGRTDPIPPYVKKDRGTYDFDTGTAGKLFTFLILKYKIRNDAALAVFLGSTHPIICKIRKGKYKVSETMILDIHEKTDMPVPEIRALIESRG